jgi:hypothetical protein
MAPRGYTLNKRTGKFQAAERLDHDGRTQQEHREAQRHEHDGEQEEGRQRNEQQDDGRAQ